MDRFSETCDQIASVSARLKKVKLLADYLRDLSDADFELAVKFLSTGPVAEEADSTTLFEMEKTQRLSVGPSILREACKKVTGWDAETLRICYREVGDTGETIGLLLKTVSADEPMSLAAANNYYQELFRSSTTTRKIDVLGSIYRKHRPGTIKYFVKVITGNLRIGLLERMVEEGVALSCGMPAERIREANNHAGNLPLVAMAARRGSLETIQAALFHPMEFMLAKPLDRLADLESPAEYVIEDKYDGMRSHLHLDHGTARIYSRNMDDITGSFPEIVEAFHDRAGSAIFDGEILAWRSDHPLNFNLLQQRIARKRVQMTHRSEIPVIFMAYDILFENGNLLLHLPLEERRRHLETALAGAPAIIHLSQQLTAITHKQIEALFQSARERGNEGLVLKRLDSRYEAGKRSGAWYKIKRPYGTLDVVISAAEQGSGRRAILLSDYTFAVRSGQQFVNVGKAYSGLTDPEIKQLTRILRAASVDRFGKVTLVRPEVVLEVAFDGVQKSSRHKSGYALRFPRILRWRRDKRPEEADDLSRVEELYQRSLQ